MRQRTLGLFILLPLLMACTKKEYKQHRCFPSCIDITIEGKIIDTLHNQYIGVPFDVYFVHAPSSWVTLIPVKDKIICSGISDKNGHIKERFTCSRSKLSEDYSVYVTFKKDQPSHGFYIQDIPKEQPVRFEYYKH